MVIDNLLEIGKSPEIKTTFFFLFLKTQLHSKKIKSGATICTPDWYRKVKVTDRAM